MKKVFAFTKGFIVHLLKTSWLKILVFILICFIIMTINDLSNIHYNEYTKLEAQLKAGEITFEQADFILRALHEQIVYQVAIAIIVSILFIAGALIEQNIKLRERVKRIDFRLWKLDRNVEEIYELQRLNSHTDEVPYDWDDVEESRPAIDVTDKAALERELERLQKQHSVRIQKLKELERKFVLLKESDKYKDED